MPRWQASPALSSMSICGTARTAARTAWKQPEFTSPIHLSKSTIQNCCCAFFLCLRVHRWVLQHASTVTKHCLLESVRSFTGGKLCGRLTDHSQAPEISQCGGVIGQFVTVAHDRDNGGSSDGAVVTICEAKVFGVRGTVDQAKCTCTPRCAQDSLNMAVRCCADVRPHDAGIECAVRQTAGYSGPLKAAIVGVGTPWYMYVLYFALAAAVIVGLVKFWPLIATKIPKGGSLKASGSGLADTSACLIQHNHTMRHSSLLPFLLFGQAASAEA
jgi:hypothetical protein